MTVAQGSLFAPPPAAPVALGTPWSARPLKGARFTGPERTYRVELWRTLGPGEGTAVWLGFNPSDGDETTDDLTITKSCKFTRRLAAARGLSLGRVLWVNPFALVSSTPTALVAALDPVGPETDAALDWAFGEATIVVAASGAIADGLPRAFRGVARRRVRDVLARAAARAPLVCLGTAAGGWPRHPARLGYATPFGPFVLVDARVHRGTPPATEDEPGGSA